jgi:hypothetical protein
MPRILYRAIRRPEPRVGEFWSDFAHGEPPTRTQLREPLFWCGISTFSDIQKAKEKARTWWQGQFVAELQIPDDAAVIVRQTGRDPLHHSVMGTPEALRSLVRNVHPVLDIVG